MNKNMTDSMLISALCNILAKGLLRIRENAALENMSACKVEADHLHNIPSLIRDQCAGALKYYYTVERPGFLKCVSDGSGDIFAEDWAIISRYIEDREGSSEKGA